MTSALYACGDDESSATGTPDGGGTGGTGSDAGGCSPACGAKQSCCAGRCIDTDSDPENCGLCGTSCSGQHSTSTCTLRQCVVQSCEQGFVDCNQNAIDGCEATDQGLPGTPHLLAPANGEYTGSVHAQASAMPLLRWFEPQSRGSCAALTYEVQVDDSCNVAAMSDCAFPSPEAEAQDIADTSYKPTQALPVTGSIPVGTIYFWRVRACEAGERCSDWSEARYLNVGRLRDDLNGDGYSDVLALSRQGIATDPHTWVIAGGTDSFGAVHAVNDTDSIDYFADARFAGDVNGDGFMDALRVDTTGATLLLGAQDIAAVQAMPILPTLTNSWHAAAALGDYNADGFADFAVSEYVALGSTAEPNSVTHIYLGSASAELGTPLDVVPPTGTTPFEFGLDLEGAFDLNGDGYTDLAIMDGDDGRLHIVYGGAAASTQIRASLQVGAPCAAYVAPERVTSHALARAGDINGDGFGDLAARCFGDGMVYLGARTPALAPVWSSQIGLTSGRNVAGGYDLGQDGLADLIFHGDGTQATNLVLLVGAADLSSTATVIPFGGRFDSTTVNKGTSFTIGDHDGDGRPDVLMHDFSEALRWFSGGHVEATTDACIQPESSFEQAGNWCEAARADIAAVYVTTSNPSTPIGITFGYVLAR